MDEPRRIVVARRRLIAGAGALAALGAGRALAGQVGSTGALGYAEIPDGALGEQSLSALPGKVPLIKKTWRPPNFETPTEYFRSVITPNNAFFVRWHLAGIPMVDGREWRLGIAGDSIERPASYSLAQLRKEFQQVEITAVCQCSGNRRGLFEPHVPGVEWGVGAMGNAVWRGVRLKDLLAKAGLKSNAVEIVFDGADHAAIDKTPDFVKSIPVEVAQDENTLIAFDMNGVALPHWNGYPARLIVPGWTGTYWVKQVVSIRAVATPESNFWMKTAYRDSPRQVPRSVVQDAGRGGQRADHDDGDELAHHVARVRPADPPRQARRRQGDRLGWRQRHRARGRVDRRRRLVEGRPPRPRLRPLLVP